MLNIDFSLFLQIANFLILLLLLNIFLYRPIRDIISRRNQEMSSLENSIDDLSDKSDKGTREIEEGMIKARKEGYLEKEKIKGLGIEKEHTLIKEAQSSSEQSVNAAQKDIDARIAEMKGVLDAHADELSNELAEKVLGRVIQ